MHDFNNSLSSSHEQFSEDLRRCIAFHGHICPGLTYGFLASKKATELLGLRRSKDEEVVVVSENDTCAVDALQVLLGTTAGKGNLIINNYGKNVFTAFSRETRRAFRFSRKSGYMYEGEHKEEFEGLEAAFVEGRATKKQRIRQKWLKTLDLLAKPFDTVFDTKEIKWSEPPYAPLASSEACVQCGEMTMATKMVEGKDGSRLCIPCAQLLGL